MKIIQPSSHQHRNREQPRTRPSQPGRAAYMTTALAVQLLPDDDEDLGDEKMGFLDHLDELRKRLIRSCIAVAVGMLVAFAFIDRIVNFVLAPTRRMLPPGTRMIYTSPGEAFGLYVNIALIAGVLLAAPFIMFQVWRFIAPGRPTRGTRRSLPHRW